MDDSTELGNRIKKLSTTRFSQYIEELFENFRNRIRTAGDNAVPSEELLRDLADLREVLNSARQLPVYKQEYDLSPWENVIEVRASLAKLKQPLDDLSKGSLWSSNANYQRYEDHSMKFEWKRFPLDYEARREEELLREVFRTIRDRARGIEESSRGDWFRGWGGRLSAPDVLEPWENLIRLIRTESRHPEISRTATELLEATDILRREFEQNRE